VISASWWGFLTWLSLTSKRKNYKGEGERNEDARTIGEGVDNSVTTQTATFKIAGAWKGNTPDWGAWEGVGSSRAAAGVRAPRRSATDPLASTTRWQKVSYWQGRDRHILCWRNKNPKI
jgi:hypothetical protein